MKTLELKKNFHWVGNLDPDLRIFDIIMQTEFGTTYNSYILKGSERTALFENTKIKCLDEYLGKVGSITQIESIDYLIVEHTEPDHAGSIETLLEINPGIKIVGSATAISFLKEIVNRDFTAIPVADGDTLSLGDKTLRFIMAPNLHWPDTMFTYIEEDRILVTCDCFGCHYSYEGITDETITDQEGYLRALRYYYDNIIGPFKSFALAAIAKIKDLSVDMIATGHGPVLVKDPHKIIALYTEWSTEVNPNKKKTVIIPYVSAYGYTAQLAVKIAEGITASGDIDVRSYDMVYSDQGKVMDELYWADGILLGTPTMIGEALKPIWDLATLMIARTHGGKLASAFGSYGWSGEGVPNIVQRLKQLRMKVYGEGFKVRFKPNPVQLQDAYEFGYNFGMSVLAGKVLEPAPEVESTAWKCVICGAVIKGAVPPQTCPVCGVGPEQFIKVSADETAFRSTKDETFVIIGNGAAGMTAAEEIRRRNKAADIELICEEAVSGYNRPMLTKGILSEIDTLNFFIKPETWFAENAVKQTLGIAVTAIDPAAKKITLSDGTERSYDKLIIATGASSSIPPMEGTGLTGVFSIRNLADVRNIQHYLPDIENVVVIGGGILGLEAAWEIKKAGKNVTVAQRSGSLMDRQLDEKGAELFRRIVETSGVNLSLGLAPERIEGEGKATGVRLADGTVLKADLVLLSTGIKANIGLAKAAGLSAERQINVNEKMETSIPGIYACGDCAAYNGVSVGIWSQAVEMGKIAGANAAGEERNYIPIIPSNSFHGMGTTLFSIGDPGRTPEQKYKSIEINDDAKGTYEKLYFVNNRFCGGILLGDVAKAPKLTEAYKNQDPLEKLL